jgi:uncharacterized protein YdiU (UPF0061 family)
MLTRGARLARRQINSMRSSSSSNISRSRPLAEVGLGTNEFTQILFAETADPKDQFKQREVRHAHYTSVTPEKVPAPYMIGVSRSCAEALELDPEALESDDFAGAFSGNALLPGLDKPWASVYGCHCYGSWFGQLGDGRAMSIGEVSVRTGQGEAEQRYELQLKGCGRTPYSRGFDGRAVVRSSIREFLISESMHHLGVSTTRALSICGTGAIVNRPWYSATEKSPAPSSGGRVYPPNQMKREPGAVLCRVAKSFVRIAQLELFAKRKEFTEMIMLADFATMREFPQLLSAKDLTRNAAGEVVSIAAGAPARYVALFKAIADATSTLVVDWIRVGYCQGNMNSDNCLVAGRTLDYGPYGMVERFDPSYQPFTSDQDGKFAFLQQPQAMHVNIVVLGDSFIALLRHRCAELGISVEETGKHVAEIESYRKAGFGSLFQQKYDRMRRCKLGLDGWGVQEGAMHQELEQLMYDSDVDYTIFYRQLSRLCATDTPAEALTRLQEAFYEHEKLDSLRERWHVWLGIYLKRVRDQEKRGESKDIEGNADGDGDGMDSSTRTSLMNQTNPKYILRNWMATMAYEHELNGNTGASIVTELTELLSEPYQEQPDLAGKWYKRTPSWAKEMPGVAFMS